MRTTKEGMSHTIKISGVSDELLTRVDQRWKGRHYADRSEYVRDLIRKDILDEPSPTDSAPPPLTIGIRRIFQTLYEEATRHGYSDEEISSDVHDALSEVRHKRGSTA